jgi:hypothetical protein
MTINGRVHSNNNIYALGSSSSQPLIFSTNVEATGQVNLLPSPLDPNANSRSLGNVIFNLSNNNPLNHANSLSLPVGTNNSSAAVIGILGIPPAGTDPSSPIGQGYEYNLADLIITNSNNGALSVYYQNLNYSASPTLVPRDVTNTTATTTNIYYSFVTNVVFYDYRESDQVKAVQLDVGNFNNWLTNTAGGFYNSKNTGGTTSKGHDIDGIYIYNGVPPGSGTLPAVRLVNGAQLPRNGLSVATPFPVYVKGNYNVTTNGINFSTTLGNTTNTRPAAIMGDAVTILSSNWVDTTTGSISLSSRNPVSTTINAACLEGIVPSNGTYYSGGVENFLRLLENWSSGTTLGYNGSIVVLFQSQYATSPWLNPGNYYNVPTRAWGFDLNFNQQVRLPPMTPQVRATIRKSWAAQ